MSATDAGFTEVLFDSLVPNLEAEGFRVVVQPSRLVLPAFMQNYRPDAIAMKKGEKLAIEIVSEASNADRRLSKLRVLFADHPDWALRVIYAPPRRSEPPIPTASREAVDKVLDALPQINKEVGPGAALLSAWSALEAAARSLLPSEIDKPQPPARLVEKLAADGHLTPREADNLRNLSHLRNQAAHGNLDVDVPPEQFDDLVHSIRALLAPAQDVAAGTSPTR